MRNSFSNTEKNGVVDGGTHAAGTPSDVWVSDNVLDYSPVKTHLPVVEESVTQTGSGQDPIRVAVMSAEAVTLVRLKISFPATGFTLMAPDYMAALLCSPKDRGVLINGLETSEERMFLPASGTFHIQGAEREVFAAAFRTEPFRRTLAALQGIDPEDVDFSMPFLTLQPDEAQHLRRLVATAIIRSGDAPEHAVRQSRQLMQMLADTLLGSMPAPPDTTRRTLARAKIVRRAEQCFAESSMDSLSLADLCEAAGVGKSALYRAFHSLYGQTPLRYFHLRRLTKARSSLLRTPAARGEVKRAALGAGLTELGRFSVEYRSLFGESPSVTLSRDAD